MKVKLQAFINNAVEIKHFIVTSLFIYTDFVSDYDDGYLDKTIP